MSTEKKIISGGCMGASVYDNRTGVRYLADDFGKLHPVLRRSTQILETIAELPIEHPVESDKNSNSSNYDISLSDPRTDDGNISDPAKDKTDTREPSKLQKEKSEPGNGRNQLRWLAVLGVIVVMCAISLVVVIKRRNNWFSSGVPAVSKYSLSSISPAISYIYLP